MVSRYLLPFLRGVSFLFWLFGYILILPAFLLFATCLRIILLLIWLPKTWHKEAQKAFRQWLEGLKSNWQHLVDLSKLETSKPQILYRKSPIPHHIFQALHLFFFFFGALTALAFFIFFAFALLKLYQTPWSQRHPFAFWLLFTLLILLLPLIDLLLSLFGLAITRKLKSYQTQKKQ